MCVSEMTVWQNKMFCGYLAGRPYPRDTRRAYASLREMLTRELPAKTLQSSIYL